MLRGLRKASDNWIGRILMGIVLALIAGVFILWGIGDIFRGFGRSTVAKIGSTEITVDQFRQIYNDRLQQLGRVLARSLPGLRVRKNQPYRGVSDGLTKVLRGRFPDPGYAGLELEVSQRFLHEPPGIAALGRAIAESVSEVIALS